MLSKDINRQASNPFQRTAAIACIALFFTIVTSARAQSSAEAASELTRRIVKNELRAEGQDDSHWLLRIDTQKPDSQHEIDELVETKQGELERPILIDGRPPTKTEEERAARRIQQMMKDASSAQKSEKEKSQDTSRSQRMLKMLPDSFIFSYGERQGNRVQLNFKPNPRFRAHNHEEEVFHAMEGSLWVDDKENRLAEISGRLTYEVKFMGGFLGHLDKGGTFDVKQEAVAPGYWELTVLNVQMRGKALFFKTISVQQKFSRSDFKRVPDNLTLAQADEMLKREVVSQRSRSKRSF